MPKSGLSFWAVHAGAWAVPLLAILAAPAFGG